MSTTMQRKPATQIARSLGEFRAAVNRSFVPLAVSSAHPDRFHGVLRGASVDDMHVTDLRATEHVVERTPALIRSSDQPYFKVSLMLTGCGLLVQGGRETVLEPGHMAVYDTSRPYTLAFDDAFRTLVLMFPHHLIGLPAALVRELTAVRISGTEGVGAIVAPYLTQLGVGLDQLGELTGARLAHTAHDLLTTLFVRELGVDAAGLDTHRALMHRVHAYIDRNLASIELGPSSIAAAHFISTRHLHELFHNQGTTVSTWIRTRRLEQCRRDLVDPVLAERPVRAIAARWGFVDAAHFSRAFKGAFGISPSEVRCPGD